MKKTLYLTLLLSSLGFNTLYATQSAAGVQTEITKEKTGVQPEAGAEGAAQQITGTTDVNNQTVPLTEKQKKAAANAEKKAKADAAKAEKKAKADAAKADKKAKADAAKADKKAKADAANPTQLPVGNISDQLQTIDEKKFKPSQKELFCGRPDIFKECIKHATNEFLSAYNSKIKRVDGLLGENVLPIYPDYTNEKLVYILETAIGEKHSKFSKPAEVTFITLLDEKGEFQGTPSNYIASKFSELPAIMQRAVVIMIDKYFNNDRILLKYLK